MLAKIAELIKHYWPIVTALTFMFGIMFSGLRYYAKAEAVELIKVEMVEPLKKLNDRANIVDQKLRDLQRDADKSSEKLNGLKEQLNIIIELMKKDQKG